MFTSTKNVLRVTALASAVCAVSMIATDSASAQNFGGGFNPGGYIRDRINTGTRSVRTELNRGRRTVQQATRGVRYRVKLYNPTNAYVYHNFNGRQQIAIPPHKVRTYSGTIVGSPRVQFNNGHGQQIRYKLSRHGSYTFRNRNGVWQLYKR